MASTKYADEGTIAHQLAAMCLTEGTDAAAYIGRLLEAEDYEHAKLSPSNAHRWTRCPGSHALELSEEFVDRFFSMEVTDDMAEYTQVYLDAVRARMNEYEFMGAVEVILLVEQRLPIGHLTGEVGATGTGDAIIIAVWADGTALIDVGDLKTGKGVEVSAEQNEQLVMYALGAVQEYGLLYDFTRARMTIYQPRVRQNPSEWEVSIEEMREFETRLKSAAARALATKEYEHNVLVQHLVPGEKQCRFCKSKADCPKLAEFVTDNVGADFEVLTKADTHADCEVAVQASAPAVLNDDNLATKMQAVDLIEDWCRAVRAEVERRLLAGTPVPGYKLVQGKKGARQWGNAEEVEATFKSMRLKVEEMYDFKLISPTTAEKLLKDSPKRWNRVTPLITQSEGKPSVAPESDKRPALTITPVEDDFDVVGDDLAG